MSGRDTGAGHEQVGSPDRGDATEVVEVPGLWFFLPLPHPIGLPNLWSHQLVLSPVEQLIAEGPNIGLSSSLLIHQLDWDRDRALMDMSELWALGAAVMSQASTESLPADLELIRRQLASDPNPLASGRTVAEVAVPGFAGDDAAAVERALEIAIEHVRFIQRAVAIATQAGVRLISRAALPPFVPTFSGVAYLSAQPPVAEQRKPEVKNAIQRFTPGSAQPFALGVRPELFDPSVMERVHHASDGLARDSPFFRYADLRREAIVLRDLDGNDRMAVVALATAGEVLLDTALLHMLWEEQTSPENAAAYFDRNEGHTARVQRYFPARLRGGWEVNSSSAAGRYLRGLVRLRHQVVHAGHEPSRTDVAEASESLLALERYLGDRLLAGPNPKKYGRTAMAWLGEAGLRRRKRWTRHMQRLARDPSAPYWPETFGRWRRHVDRALQPGADPPGQDANLLLLYVEKLDDGSIRWVVHDIAAAYAAVVDPKTVRSDEEIELVMEMMSKQTGQSVADRRLASPLRAEVPSGVTWQPDYAVLPDLPLFAGRPTPAP